MEPEDFCGIRSTLVLLASKLRTDISFFYGIPFLETVEIMKEVAKVGKKR